MNTDSLPLSPTEVDTVVTRFMRDWFAIVETRFYEVAVFALCDVCEILSDADVHVLKGDIKALRTENDGAVERWARAVATGSGSSGDFLRRLYVKEDPAALAECGPLAFWTGDIPMGDGDSVGNSFQEMTVALAGMAGMSGGFLADALVTFTHHRGLLARGARFDDVDRMGLITYVTRCHATAAISPTAAREAWEGV